MAKGTCQFEGCEAPSHLRGWCIRHYGRWLHHGDPSIVYKTGGKRHPNPRELFWRRVEKTDDCWIWRGAVTKNSPAAGYGILSRKTYGENLAHRYAWRDLIGPIPAGMVLDHQCRNRACVRPGDGHLRVVTQAVNAMENTTRRRDRRTGRWAS